MSTATLQRPSEFDALAADNDNFDIVEGQMDIHVRRAVARMIAFCEGNSAAAQFLARGLVIDTLGDINQQIHDYFPAHIDVTPIIDDIAFVVATTAKKSGQRFQEVSLAYISDGKIPEQENANKQSFVKWYSVDGASNGSEFDGFNKALKPGYSGGAGGSGADMLKHLNLATKKGFLLVVASLDIADAHAQSLMADIGMVQAFGNAPATLNAVADVMSGGGAPAKQMDNAIQQIIEIKTLKAALVDAGTGPQAAPIAAALALKTEALAVSLPVIQAAMPPAAAKEITRQIDGVKVDMAATQMARAIETIATSALPANNVTTAQVIQAVEAVKTVAAANNLSVADVVTLVMTQSAPPALIEPVRAMTAVLSKPEVLPAIERSVPQAVAQSIRADLTTPPLAMASTTPIMPQPIVQALTTLSQKTGIPTLAEAAVAMQSTIPAAAAGPVSVPPTMTVQAVADNLQAMMFSKNVPPQVKAELAVMVPQVQAMVIQLRDPAPMQMGIPGPAPLPAPMQMAAQTTAPAPSMVITAPVAPTAAAAFIAPAAPAVPAIQVAPAAPAIPTVFTASAAPTPIQSAPVMPAPTGVAPVVAAGPVTFDAVKPPVQAQFEPQAPAKGPAQFDSQYATGPGQDGRAQVALSPYSPLAMAATASGGTAPYSLAQSPWTSSQYSSATPAHPYSIGHSGASPWTPKADNSNGFKTGAGTSAEVAQAGGVKKEDAAKSGKCPSCSKGFNCASCGLTEAAGKLIAQEATQSHTLARRYGHG